MLVEVVEEGGEEDEDADLYDGIFEGGEELDGCGVNFFRLWFCDEEDFTNPVEGDGVEETEEEVVEVLFEGWHYKLIIMYLYIILIILLYVRVYGIWYLF
jgi:hypothetical protein